jgi:predicted nucleic acid-binding Zn ribbon protein
MKPAKRKSHKLHSTAEVLQSLLKNGKEPLSQQFESLRLNQEWPRIVGATMAKHSKPLGMTRTILHVWVDSSARLQEMIFLVKPIKDQINQFLGTNSIKRIQFTLDKGNVPRQSPKTD